MIKYTIALFFSVSIMNTQTSAGQITNEVKVGDVFEIGTPKSKTYQHIDFPRPNLIIKRGGIVNYKRVQGKKVVVTSVKEKKDGSARIIIRRIDGGRFLGSHMMVAANFDEAVKSGELQMLYNFLIG